jgi:hypothetical protein
VGVAEDNNQADLSEHNFKQLFGIRGTQLKTIKQTYGKKIT